MNKITEVFEDQHVRAVVAFGHTDGKLYTDATHATQLTEAEATELFQKQVLLVQSGDDLLKPVKLSGNKVYTIAESDSAVSLTEWAAAEE